MLATARSMVERAWRIIPVRLTDLWLARPDGEMDVLGDSALYVNHYRLDEPAAFIWERCNGQNNAWEIARALAKECESSAPAFEEVLSDVLSALDGFRERQLVGWRPEESCDVLFVFPPFPTTYRQEAIKAPEFLAPPLGLAYLAAFLRQAGFSVAIKDLQVEALKPEDVVAACRSLAPRVVGITATTPTYPNALRTARHVKAWNPETRVVLGGVHATGMPEECLADGPFDYIVMGEGEVTMLELCQHLIHGEGRAEEIPGLAFLDSDKGLILTPPRQPIADLDSLPFPARDLLDMQRYAKKGAICGSRGCPHNCIFCACHVIFGHRYRTPSVGRIIEELEHLRDVYGIDEIDFNDDTLNWNAGRLFSLCRQIQEHGLKIRWACFSRASEMTPEMALAMAKAGCDAVQFGVESGSPDILQQIGKKTTLSQIEKAVKAASKAGIQAVVCGIMIGHPHDTIQTVRQTIDFADHLLKIGATRIMLSLLTPYPGTQIYRQADKIGLRILTTDWEQYILSRVVLETENLSKDVLRELYTEGLIRFLLYERTMEGFWKPVKRT